MGLGQVFKVVLCILLRVFSVGRVGILFDFDGTLSPLDVSRDVARVRDDVAAVFGELVKRYVVGVVSSKDCSFLLSRVPSLQGYACVDGLEVLVGDYLILDSAVTSRELLKSIEDVHAEARGLRDVFVEEKRSLLGFLLGFSIDWRRRGGPPEGLDRVVREARGLENVVITGELSEEMKASLIKASYLNIIISKMEALGITQIEFMYGGVPVVSSGVYGQRWLVANGVDGVLVNGPDDIEGAAKAVEELIKNPNEREEMSANARRKASSLLMSKLMEQLLDRAKTILKS